MNFDRVARPYRTIEHVVYGRALERCRTALLPVLEAPRRALLIGEGDGRFLQAFLRRFPETSVDVVEASGRMIELARGRVSGRVRFVQADAMETEFDPGAYDLVVTHFFLDVLSEEDVVKLVERLRVAAPGGKWLLSDFRVSQESAARRVATAGLIAVMYAFFRIVSGLRTRSIPDFDAVFRRAGMKRLECRRMLGGFLTAELWSIPLPP